MLISDFRVSIKAENNFCVAVFSFVIQWDCVLNHIFIAAVNKILRDINVNITKEDILSIIDVFNIVRVEDKASVTIKAKRNIAA